MSKVGEIEYTHVHAGQGWGNLGSTGPHHSHAEHKIVNASFLVLIKNSSNTIKITSFFDPPK